MRWEDEIRKIAGIKWIRREIRRQENEKLRRGYIQ